MAPQPTNLQLLTALNTVLANQTTILENQKTIMSNITSVLNTVQTLNASLSDLKNVVATVSANVTTLKANQVDPNDLVTLVQGLQSAIQSVADIGAGLKAL